MLRLNISIVLSFIRICLNLMNSSADDNMKLIKSYKKRLVFNDLHAEYSPVLPYNDVCNMSREDRVAVCKNAIRQLRSKNKGNIYMNYLAFIEQEPCTPVRVWINKGNVLAHQTALNCFGRSAISALESQEEMVHFYRRIVIYPQTTYLTWVFEYNEDKDYYIILTRIQLIWTTSRTLTAADFNGLFSIPTPQGWRNISNLFTILYPIHRQLILHSNPTENPTNIVHSTTCYIHHKICFLVLRSENYNKTFNYNTRQIRKLEPKKLQATLRGPTDDLSVPIMAYNCNHSVKGDKTFMSKYIIAAGPGDHSVILLEDVNSDNNHIPHYVIIELVQYMTEDYIAAYFNKFY